MKIEKINDNKIKVTISFNDLEERNIDLNSMYYNSPDASQFILDMIEQAEILYGFSVYNSQAYVETIIDSEDGFVLIISKPESDEDFESIQNYIKNKFKKTELRTKKKSNKICSTVLIYSFQSFEDIIKLCNRIRYIYTGNSSLFKYKDTYYLNLTQNTLSVKNLKHFESILNEYGTKISNTNFFEGYLGEHASPIAESNAVEIVLSYF